MGNIGQKPESQEYPIKVKVICAILYEKRVGLVSVKLGTPVALI